MSLSWKAFLGLWLKFFHMADGQRLITRGSAVTDVNINNVQQQLLQQKTKLDDVLKTSPVLLFTVFQGLQKERMDVGHCSQPFLVTDRSVSKIKMSTEPKMREERVNNCTSSGALPQLSSLRKPTNRIRRPELIFKLKEDPKGVTQHNI